MSEELSGSTTVRLDLRSARLIIDRGLTKASEFTVRGSFAVCDDAGVLISLSRMQGASAVGAHITRGKAILSAVHQERSDALARRMGDSLAAFHAIRALHPEIYPGAGAHFIKVGGRVVGAYASGSGYGPLVRIAGVDPDELTVDGEQVNVEDLITAYALGIAYREQHPGSKLVERSQGELDEYNVGEFVFDGDAADTWTDFGEARPSLTLQAARTVADALIALAEEESTALSVAVCDEVGAVMQLDRMIDAPPAAVRLAEERARACFDEGVDRACAALLRAADGRVLGSVGVAGAGAGLFESRLLEAAAAAIR